MSRSSRRRSLRRRRGRALRRMTPLLVVLGLASTGLLLGAAFVGWQGLHVKHDLEQARTALDQAESAVTVGDVSTAGTAVRDAATAARRAARQSDGVVWSAYAHLPVVGALLTETRGVAREAATVAGEALPTLVDSLQGQARWQGHADLPMLQRLAPSLVRAAATIDGSQRRLATLPYCRVAAVDDARESLSGAVSRLAADVHEAAVAAQVVPRLLGADRPGRLLVVTQNQAEERATGGLLGAFAVLGTDRGRFAKELSGTDNDLTDAPSPVVDLGPDFRSRYGLAEASATWRSANLTPDVPSAGAILAGLSARQLGKKVDGVVFVDPVALSLVLGATGPVEVPGLGVLNADNAVPVLLKDVYARYSRLDQQPQRKAALKEALDAVVSRLQRPLPGGGLAHALTRAAATGHLQVFATDPAVEAILAGSQVAGALPTSGPYLSLVTQDVGGSKLDYYLHRTISYVATPSTVAVDLGAGPETVEDATVTIQLRNDAPSTGLPAYVTTRADVPALSGTGQLRSWVSLYLGPRSTYTDATLDGRPVALSSQVEKGLSVLSTYVSIDPGETATLVLHVQQPTPEDAPLVWRQQPRLKADDVVVRRGPRAGRLETYYTLG